jgi:hypothetical protein
LPAIISRFVILAERMPCDRLGEGAMAPFRVTVVQCRGTPYEVGRAQAESFALTSKGRGLVRRKAIRLPDWFDLHAEQSAFARFAPKIWEEIGGLADGLGISMERAVLRQWRHAPADRRLLGRDGQWRVRAKL